MSTVKEYSPPAPPTIRKTEKEEPTMKGEGILDNEGDHHHPPPGTSRNSQEGKELVTFKDVVAVPGVFEDVAPVDSIPDEILLMIFGMLGRSDKLSCFRTCPKWKGLLWDKRNMLIFPEVVPVLLKKFPALASPETRLVCRSWKEGVDLAYQSRPDHLHLHPEDSVEPTIHYKNRPLSEEELQALPSHIRPDFKTKVVYTYTGKLDNHFHSAEAIDRFLADMVSHSGNPFPGREITLSFRQPGEFDNENNLCQEFWTSATRLVERFGAHIHIATIELGFDELYDTEMESNFRNVMLHLPHLKRLNVDGISGAPGDRIRDFFVANPLPLLADLETLTFQNVAQALIDAVLESCCVPAKIRRLNLEPNDDNVEMSEFVYRFSNLEVLAASLFVEDLERFGNMEGPPPPLRALDLGFWNTPDFHRVFVSLELFATSLKSVLVKEPFVDEEGLRLTTTDPFRINLPNLEKLVLLHYAGPLDPCLQLSSLTHLDIMCHGGLKKWEGSLVDFYGVEYRMYQSNVWDLMPNLKFLMLTLPYAKPVRFDRKTFERQAVAN